MDQQSTVSKNIIDRRRVATHGVSGIVGILLGLIFGVARAPGGPDGDLVQVTSTALDRGQTYWAAEIGPSWRDARVILIDHDTKTPCGTAGRSSGPFYCPADERIYLDLSFLRAIDGDLARAYVVAHELGHHVQKLRGELRASRPSVDVELEADCYAGRWMRTEQVAQHLGPSDVPGAIAEAEAVGDDRICPGCSAEQWTHGSSSARAGALAQGIGGLTCH